MIESIDKFLTEITTLFGKINGAPGYVLTFILCIAMGYALKVCPKFPNQGIPLTVILTGTIINMLIADPRADDFPIRVWVVKNFTVGFIIGVTAWLFHKFILKRVEKKLGFGSGFDTTIITK